MKLQRVYIDTSVIGGCFDPEFATWSNGLMKDFRLGNFTPVVSEIIAAEIATAPARVQDRYGELLDCSPESAELTIEVRDLADAYGRTAHRGRYFRGGGYSRELELQAYRSLRQDTHV